MNLSHRPIPRRNAHAWGLCLVTIAGLATLAGVLAMSAARAQGAWSITSFDARYAVNADGTIDVTEDIAVDFGALRRHGIIRELFERVPCGKPAPGDERQPVYDCPQGSDRIYRYSRVRVAGSGGEQVKSAIEHAAGSLLIRIGDADVEVTGRQEYRISYRVDGALNAFEDHVELYWNVSGTWPEADIERFTATVTLPAGAVTEAICFQGYAGVVDRCDIDIAGRTARYVTTRVLITGEQATVGAAWAPDVVAVPPPYLQDQPSFDDYVEFDWLEFGLMGLLGAGVAAGIAGAWWNGGRDRAYKTLFYLTNDPREGTRPLFARRDIVVEFVPPDDLRPAQMGLILDERADTLDVTATIIDLAVRGHLHITEVAKKSWFGKTDWILKRTSGGQGDLLPYEQDIYTGLFPSTDEVRLSALRNRFYKPLERAQAALYADAAQRHWFAVAPQFARQLWAGIGAAVFVVGGIATAAFALFAGRALIGVPITVAGMVLMVLAQAMPRRSAKGSEALRRVLGFRLYIVTAETRRQEFNEQRNIFARYLPYAIVFGCVEKWAKAFEGLDDMAEESVRGWYIGSGAFRVAAFSAGLSTFSTSVSSTITSTPGSSGRSGFGGGGGAGGGGGGGGGRSW